MQKLEKFYDGKAKQVFSTDDPEYVIIHYTDAATAFNNIKKATIVNKGILNNAISALIFEQLARAASRPTTSARSTNASSCAAASRLSRSRSSSATSSQGRWRSGSASRRGRGRRT